ncbi:MAG TPA: amylo-alpha-1,6-glucosidase [Ktedonobacterales bacterium]|jgi:predicted glycogen debranching enzyme|nr:amylo-alpha-1,6-glucosidase [Ktedonobacterales bacterium]
MMSEQPIGQRDDAPELPTLTLAPEAYGALDAALAHEWLVTNGIGGYAMGTLSGATTRCYHGYLIAAPRVPQERVALVTKLDERVTLADGAQIALGTDEYADGTVDPRGYERLTGFALEGLIPCFSYRLAEGLTLEKRLWMEHGANITFVQYRLVTAPDASGPGSATVTLRIEPFLVWRDHHASQQGNPDWHFALETEPAACVARATPAADPCRLTAGPAARFEASGLWYWHIEHRAEWARGLPDEEDVYLPGAFTVSLAPGATASLVLSVGDATGALPDGAVPGGADHEEIVARALARERARERRLLEQASAHDDLVQRLTLAADQFIVGRRPAPATPADGEADPAVTVIAGYPWFTDWGRDTMIALPGLTLATGRTAEARGLLRGFTAFMSQGMIPNRFPDQAGDAPEYNTVDATLWLFHALDAYLSATGDWPLLDQLFNLLDSSIDWHIRGTWYGIGVDASDGLLRAGAPGVQLTWMDAKVGDWVVTPRWGKPIEICALWYRALRLMTGWAERLDRDADPYVALAAEARANFAARFWYAAGGYFYDVVDIAGESGTADASLRPNQVLALAVAPELASVEQARSALAVVERELLTPLGLRTLAPSDPRFLGIYGGDQRSRDGAYHQGTVWPWLLGAYAEARAHAFPEEDMAATCARLLAPLEAHLREAGVGSISEIAWGALPFTPDGCPAQAWSVAEALRLARGVAPRR